MDQRKQLQNPFPSFPARAAHDAAWEELARNIAAMPRLSAEPREGEPAGPRGQLTVIGSGIETAGFTDLDESLIEAADKVFYCVADPATVVWLKARRPDAYDLYVLYDEGKVRYITYMQMTEALLYYVRQGLNVVAVYYGHPGIFVLSTHRAIQIARREGHCATMRANVSALDTLCADLGVDPSQPGMQTFEATDMLIRGRAPDTGLHVVLWQVGVIGELGYRRGGFLNTGLSTLIEYLQSFYGKDYPVTNYIGSRYPGVVPVTEVYRLSQFHDPELQSTVTGISTFYLAPKDVAPANLSMMVRLGLATPGSTIRPQASPLREIGGYGERESPAFEQFRTFKVPRGYHWQEDTAAARFILALRADGELRELYSRDPLVAVGPDCFSGLSARERSMLATRDAGAVQLAAKGAATVKSVNTPLLHELAAAKPLARSMYRAARLADSSTLAVTLESWAASHGRSADGWRMLEDWEALRRGKLFIWNGAYVSADPQVMIFILGNKRDSRQDRLWVNDVLIRNFQFQHGRLRWKAAHGNPHNGFVHVDSSPAGIRRLTGSIWPEREEVPARHRFSAKEADSGRYRLCQFVGDYEAGGAHYRITVCHDEASGPYVRVFCDGQPVDAPVEIERTGLRIDGALIPFRSLLRDGLVPQALRASYVARGRIHLPTVVRVGADSLEIDGQLVAAHTWRGGKLKWSGGPAPFPTGELTLLIDPISLLPMCYGAAGAPALPITGMQPAAPQDELRKHANEFALPGWAWNHLVDIAHSYSHRGGLFLWNAWERHSFTHRILQTVLTRQRAA
ncbi:MAG: SAM-dependent methyltransferase [Nitrospira sp.]|nr:SAM-dependent methyltransferase [Nitrospira sp.]MDH4242683.1 SAM-dependent methyltransferase [Nitrospira sp.]MDH4355048.1 SAM-dependent methyltransferase [Nitrospira sp.]MDH5316966.1 SAM-dependent methyltransferase [Nitrospira sp.]